MTAIDQKTIHGVSLEAIRFKQPVPHWRVKFPNGVIAGTGEGFDATTKPKLWKKVEYQVSRLGAERIYACYGIHTSSEAENLQT